MKEELKVFGVCFVSLMLAAQGILRVFHLCENIKRKLHFGRRYSLGTTEVETSGSILVTQSSDGGSCSRVLFPW